MFIKKNVYKKNYLFKIFFVFFLLKCCETLAHFSIKENNFTKCLID